MENKNESDAVNNSFKTQEKHEIKSIVELTDLTQGWCFIQYGYNESRDFVIHFTSHHERRMIPSNPERVYQIIVTYLDKVIAPELKKDFFPSPENWEKKLITVKVLKAGEKWNFDEEKVITQLKVIGDLISKEIEKNSPRQRYM